MVDKFYSSIATYQGGEWEMVIRAIKWRSI